MGRTEGKDLFRNSFVFLSYCSSSHSQVVRFLSLGFAGVYQQESLSCGHGCLQKSGSPMHPPLGRSGGPIQPLPGPVRARQSLRDDSQGPAGRHPWSPNAPCVTLPGLAHRFASRRRALTGPGNGSVATGVAADRSHHATTKQLPVSDL